jgi:hypothetical protein
MSACPNTKWKSTSSKKSLFSHKGDRVGVASIRSKDLIKTFLQCEESKIDLPRAKFVVGLDHLCDQAINLIGKTMIPLSHQLESPEKERLRMFASGGWVGWVGSCIC